MRPKFNWTEDIEEEICALLASGSSIRDIGVLKGFPSEPTIYRRMAVDDVFSKRIAEARAAQQDFEIEQCVKMADEATPDDWQVVKLRIWARQWRASKLAPKKYGDKQDINITGKVSLEAMVADDKAE